MHSMFPLLFFFISLAIAFSAIYLLRLSGPLRLIALPVSLLVCAIVLISIAFLVADYFTGQGIDESVAFHLQYGVAGAGHGEYAHVIFLALSSLYIAVNVTLCVFLALSRTSERRSKSFLFLGTVLLVSAFVINPGVGNLRTLIGHEFPPGFGEQANPEPNGGSVPRNSDLQLRIDAFHVDGINREFVRTSQEVAPGRGLMNIVYLYLEGLEQTYFDESLFPGLLPRLNRIRSQGLSFSDIRQVYGTGWTIAGMVASQCGIPLVTTSPHQSMNNSMAGMDDFLSGATCLGDILHGYGYTLAYLGGASLEFAGKGKFYQTHGFSHVIGREDILARLEAGTDASGVTPRNQDIEKKPGIFSRINHFRVFRWIREFFSTFALGRNSGGAHVSAWGIHDDLLFDHAEEILNDLASASQPFALVLLTLDTHHPAGHVSPSCTDVAYADGGNPMLNAVHCADQLVSGFLERIMTTEYADNTLIVVSSDHLALRNTASNLLERGERRNLLFFLHPGGTAGSVSDRPGTLLDVGPTLLGLLGGLGTGQTALGFGRDLLGPELTLAERSTDIDAFLMSQRRQLALLWNLPRVDEGFLVDVHGKRVEFSNRPINLPVLLTVDEGLAVQDIYFESDSAITLKDYLRELPGNQGWMWIDTCRNIAAVTPAIDLNKDFCIAMGRLDALHVSSLHLPETRYFEKSFLAQALDVPVDTAGARQRRARLRNLSLFDVHNLEDLPTLSLPEGSMDSGLIVSSFGGFKGGPSTLADIASEQTTVLELDRGLHLIGVDRNGAAMHVAHFDSCQPEDMSRFASQNGFFVSAIEEHRENFGTFIILVHDTGKCAKEVNLSLLFQGLPLKKWPRLEHRQPYIAVFRDQEVFHEALGDREHQLRLFIR